MYQSPSQGILPKDDFQEKKKQNRTMGTVSKKQAEMTFLQGRTRRGAAKLEANMQLHTQIYSLQESRRRKEQGSSRGQRGIVMQLAVAVFFSHIRTEEGIPSLFLLQNICMPDQYQRQIYCSFLLLLIKGMIFEYQDNVMFCHLLPQ